MRPRTVPVVQGLENQPRVSAWIGLEAENIRFLSNLQDARVSQGVVMSFNAFRWAIKQQCPPFPKLVLLILADHANTDGQCWPSMATICIETGLSRSSAVRAINKLVKLGLIRKSGRWIAHEQTSNSYRLLIAMPELREGGVTQTLPPVTQTHRTTPS